MSSGIGKRPARCSDGDALDGSRCHSRPSIIESVTAPVDTMFPISPSSCALDQLFEAQEFHPNKRQELPWHAALRACLAGDLPAGSLPPLAGEQPGSKASRPQSIRDLDVVLACFEQPRQHGERLRALLCFCVSELARQLRKDPTADAANATSLLTAARRLSRCLEAYEAWPDIRHLYEQKMNRSFHALLVPRWQRLNALWEDVRHAAEGSGIDPRDPGVLRLEHVNDLHRRIDSLVGSTSDMLATGSVFSTLASPGALDDRDLSKVLSTYEDIAAEALRRAEVKGSPGAAVAVRRRIAAYDGKRPELLLLDEKMSEMRNALLGARMVPARTDGPRPQRPVAMVALPRPSSSSSLSSSDNEGASARPVQVEGFTELFERG